MTFDRVRRYSRTSIIAGLAAMAVAVLDPLEGSV